jgi:hypothetical protein
MFIAALSSLPPLTSAVHREKQGENRTRKEVEFNKRLDGLTDPVEDDRFDGPIGAAVQRLGSKPKEN